MLPFLFLLDLPKNITMNSYTFAETHAQRLFPNPEDILDKIEIEGRILDLFEEVRYKGFLSFSEYQKLCYLEIPFLNMLSGYKKVEHHIALELIKREYVTYDNLMSILVYEIE